MEFDRMETFLMKEEKAFVDGESTGCPVRSMQCTVLVVLYANVAVPFVGVDTTVEETV